MGLFIFLILVIAVLAFLLLKKWYAEAIFITIDVALMPYSGLLFLSMSMVGDVQLYPHLVVENGLSFPLGHASASLMFYTCLMVLICQRLNNQQMKWLVACFIQHVHCRDLHISDLSTGTFSDGYIGWLADEWKYLLITYPIYDEVRFKWRFKGVQK